MADDRIVMGFDPGTSTTGWAVLRGTRDPELVGCGALRAPAKQPIEQRLHHIFTGVLDLLRTHQPDVVAVEDPFVGKNPNGALTLGQARGVILLAVAQHKSRLVNYAPATIKQSVAGRGNAEKEQVREMVTRLLKLPEPPEPLDASDAVAVALCHLNRGEWLQPAREPGHPSASTADSLLRNGADDDRDDTPPAAKRARKLAAREEDADALARWLSGGRKR